MTTERTVKLRLSGYQHSALFGYLFPGDGKERVAFALCGMGQVLEEGLHRCVVCVNEVHCLPESAYLARDEHRVSWSTEMIIPILQEARVGHQALLKIHGHPTDAPGFSILDDQADQELFMGIAGWLDSDYPGLSAIMLPDGKIIARSVQADGSFGEVECTCVAGSDIRMWYSARNTSYDVPEAALRTAQAFGSGTTELLSRLSIGVVGCSGTGSPLVEMLYRLGVGELVLVDDDVVEEKNLNRMLNASVYDASQNRLKVDVLGDAIRRSGLPSRPVCIAKNLFCAGVIRRVAQCDVVFGCMDSVDGRDLLNRVCTFYTIPYFDLGVRLDADGSGGVAQVCATVNYIQPGGSSLLTRGVYTIGDLEASSLLRANLEEYSNRLRSGYIKGVQEDRPAVISINTLIASLAVNDFLARVHPFRDDPNSDISQLTVSLTQNRLVIEGEGPPCQILAECVGAGDVLPLLNMPVLSEREESND